jgi:hypothetical protein
MYIYHIPYLPKKDDAHCLIHTIFCDKELLLVPLLKKFLIEIRHSYIDEDYDAFSNAIILEIAVDVYFIEHIKIQRIEQNLKMKVGSFLVKRQFRRLKHFNVMLEYMEKQKEIILSTEIDYASLTEGLTADEVNICHNGVERFLFSFSNGDQCGDWEYEGNDYKTILFEDGISIFDEFEIKKPLMGKEQILDVFVEWSKMIGIDLTGKTVRMANNQDFMRRPFLDELEDSIKQDPDHVFAIPSQYLYFFRKDVPSTDQLIEDLNNEKPGTIACVIDDFKDETMMKILDGIDSKKRNEVIQLLPQVPTMTFTERKRFMDLFEYDVDFIKQRMSSIKREFGDYFDLNIKKNDGTKREKDRVAEYEAWQYYIQKRNGEQI